MKFFVKSRSHEIENKKSQNEQKYKQIDSVSEDLRFPRIVIKHLGTAKISYIVINISCRWRRAYLLKSVF